MLLTKDWCINKANIKEGKDKRGERTKRETNIEDSMCFDNRHSSWHGIIIYSGRIIPTVKGGKEKKEEKERKIMKLNILLLHN